MGDYQFLELALCHLWTISGGEFGDDVYIHDDRSERKLWKISSSIGGIALIPRIDNLPSPSIFVL
jgi:hypothetical protein